MNPGAPPIPVYEAGILEVLASFWAKNTARVEIYGYEVLIQRKFGSETTSYR